MRKFMENEQPSSPLPDSQQPAPAPFSVPGPSPTPTPTPTVTAAEVIPEASPATPPVPGLVAGPHPMEVVLPVTSTGLRIPVATGGASQEPIPTPKNNALNRRFIKLIIGVLVMTAIFWAVLYYGGFLQQQPDQLNGAAPASSSEQLTGSQASTQELAVFTQAPLSACSVGQTLDPKTNQCGCDINNNYFEVNIPDAYKQPTAGQPLLVCTTCAQLSDQIIQLGQSNDPQDIMKKNGLQQVSQQNNCTTCIVFDNRIAQAYQDKNWTAYFQYVVEKSQDKTCGRSLPSCDSMKWQLLFLNDLVGQAAKDSTTPPEMLQSLEQQQQSLSEDLANNTTCYDIQSVCVNLQAAYQTQKQNAGAGSSNQTIKVAPMIGTNNQNSSQQIDQSLTQSQQTQQTEQATSVSQQAISDSSQQSLPDGTPVDFSSVVPSQLFSKNFYLLHCPVDNPSSSASTRKVKRVITPPVAS